MFDKSHKTTRPSIFEGIIEGAGYDAAMTLALACGGSRIYIPQNVRNTRLERLVGTEVTAAISKVSANCVIEVPLANERLVFWLEARGESQDEIARKLRLTRRAVQRIMAGDYIPWPV